MAPVKEILLLCLLARFAMNERPWMPYISKYLTFCIHSSSQDGTYLESNKKLKGCRIPEKTATFSKCSMTISSLYGRINSIIDITCPVQTYILVVSSHFHLNLTVLEFFLHHAFSGQCLYGNVTLSEKYYGRNIVRGEYCGHLPPWTVYSYSSNLLITYFNQHLYHSKSILKFYMTFQVTDAKEKMKRPQVGFLDVTKEKNLVETGWLTHSFHRKESIMKIRGEIHDCIRIHMATFRPIVTYNIEQFYRFMMDPQPMH